MDHSNPQAEEGHVDIANGIVEALCRVQLSGYESRVLWALFRKTYGWHKKEDRISLTQFQALTGLPIPKISNTLNRLVLRKMVRVTENGNGKIKSYGFQKVFSVWQDLPEKVLPKSAIPKKGITENGLQGLPFSASTKETITKEKGIASNTIPFHDIIAAYNKFCPTLPAVNSLFIPPTRHHLIKAAFLRYRDNDGGALPVLDLLFKKAEASNFLTGKTPGHDGKFFKAKFDWLFDENKMVKVLEGDYDNPHTEAGSSKAREEEIAYLKREGLI